MTIYVAGCDGSRLVKIGCTMGDVSVRIRGMQVGSPSLLRLLWQSGPEHGMETELTLHLVFAPYRQHGEWFDFGNADQVALISSAVMLPALQPPRLVARFPRVRSKYPSKQPVTVLRLPLESLLDDLDVVLGEHVVSAATAAALLVGTFPDGRYSGATGKSLVIALSQLGVRVPKTNNRWPIRPDIIRSVAVASRLTGALRGSR